MSSQNPETKIAKKCPLSESSLVHFLCGSHDLDLSILTDESHLPPANF